ncbi:MAG: bifunctional diaminohydroxyphosphoribosylaminopyrimidine deaminase/5-amino-6-(5-phosphoribosylamino)uracil reductase RibD [Alphaproteobacteria bacterium]
MSAPLSQDQALQEAQDRRFMAAAIRMGTRGLGCTAPNPAVGCLIVDPDGPTVLARGVTRSGGRPHAEAVALEKAGARARGATAYVTLEPCAHHGRTPPCAEALAAAGLARVVVGIGDPDPRVAGKGIAKLKAAGIAVTEGVLAEAARDLTMGFLSRVSRRRPMVTVKLASSMDGRIAAPGGVSQWITGPTARAHGHGLRASHDAILVGTTTAIVDNPRLTCRLPGLEQRSPIRIVTDGGLRVPLTHSLVASARDIPTWVLTAPDAAPARRRALEGAGVTVLTVPRRPGQGLDLNAALALLADRGMTRLLVEGGATLVASLIADGCVDRLYWYRAPMVLGGNGIAAIGGLDVAHPRMAPGFVLRSTRRLGPDTLEIFQPAGAGRVDRERGPSR